MRTYTSREEMDGTVVELLHGLDYVRAADTRGYELHRVAAAADPGQNDFV